MIVIAAFHCKRDRLLRLRQSSLHKPDISSFLLTCLFSSLGSIWGDFPFFNTNAFFAVAGRIERGEACILSQTEHKKRRPLLYSPQRHANA